uniref:Uncharacterized protein n=1 Tax=Cucumis melo TaxID=3656 RepID=A0A9I9CL78_CUCME
MHREHRNSVSTKSGTPHASHVGLSPSVRSVRFGPFPFSLTRADSHTCQSVGGHLTLGGSSQPLESTDDRHVSRK